MQAILDQKICIIGLGYIGLPTAAVLASRGYTVHGVEINAKAVQTINSGKAHIVEPQLDMLVRASVQTGKLKAHTSPTKSDIFMLCVPTPLDEARKPELKYVRSAAKSICPLLQEGNLVILESTSPPGTTEMIAQIVLEQTGLTTDQIHFAHAPERVLPGKILREVVENDRIIGGINESATQVAAAFYETFVSGKLLCTHCRLAETAKLVENAYRDVNIAFANELSLVADELELDVWQLIDFANHHPRVNILQPGPGVGGHCIAVDPWFLVDRVPGVTHLIKTARQVNEAKPQWVVDRVCEKAKRFKEPKIACLGLAYKPDIDDLRESPAVAIVRDLQEKIDGQLYIVEPNINEHHQFKLSSLDGAMRQADIVVLLVAHKQFKAISPGLLAEKVLIDTCGALRAGQ